MAGTSLLMLLDDIATTLDDIAILTKVAAKKTAGVLGDDLALNAQQVTGVASKRELPVVWAVTKGSFLNKLILVPLALALSAFLPWLITPLLMLGGAYLCYEGFEKVMHFFFHDKVKDEEKHKDLIDAYADKEVDMAAFEQQKIKGAIRTDLILSAEIIVIALGTAKDAPFVSQVLIVSIIAILMTIGVYGLVAAIVKLDDVGVHLNRNTMKNAWGSFKRWVGKMLIIIAPKLMKTLSIVGTIAMFLVGGGILLHGIPQAHGLIEVIEHWAQQAPLSGLVEVFSNILLNLFFGLIAGGLVVLIVKLLSPVSKIFKKA